MRSPAKHTDWLSPKTTTSPRGSCAAGAAENSVLRTEPSGNDEGHPSAKRCDSVATGVDRRSEPEDPRRRAWIDDGPTGSETKARAPPMNPVDRFQIQSCRRGSSWVRLQTLWSTALSMSFCHEPNGSKVKSCGSVADPSVPVRKLMVPRRKCPPRALAVRFSREASGLDAALRRTPPAAPRPRATGNSTHRLPGLRTPSPGACACSRRPGRAASRPPRRRYRST